MYNILICDDDRDIVNALKIFLTDSSYTLFEAYDGQEALDLVMRNDIHLILLDVMMPNMDGITAMVEIRKFCNSPIILLTAKSEDADKIMGLDMGADDYITKPFSPTEVTARVRSQLRRYMMLGARAPTRTLVTVGPVELDNEAKRVCVDGTPVSLTPTEYEILKLLMLNQGKVFSPWDIYHAIWQSVPLSNDKTIAVHIRHIREKIEINPADPRFLKAVWGHGYTMEDPKS